ncbi:MAG: YraN family protein [Muribaculaceae bacterium]|nr:YraN family protein [Muribaculaceae bacterium]MDE6551618.1 YraN family protein [Muribaculaceae bacterium]
MAEKNKEAAKEWGKQAENIVCEYLITKGYTVRERNWRPSSSHSEIDLIAQIGDTIAFVEVKARSDRDTDPTDAITQEKIKNVVRGANSYLLSQDKDYYYRFDVAAVNGNVDNYTLDYLEDAFLPPLRGR